MNKPLSNKALLSCFYGDRQECSNFYSHVSSELWKLSSGRFKFFGPIFSQRCFIRFILTSQHKMQFNLGHLLHIYMKKERKKNQVADWHKFSVTILS